MTDPAGHDAGDGRDQLRDEAALWFARMRGGAADAHKLEFEQWLARGALHRAAYNRIAEIFSAGKALRDEPEYADAGLVARRRDHSAGRRLALPMSVLALLVAGIWLSLNMLGGQDPVGKSAEIRSPDARASQLATVVGEMRRVGLADGSYLTLDTDTLVVADVSNKRRLFRLERGRARFEVAHDPRPFIVLAGRGSVTAHGTVFDVALALDREVSVRLLRGSVQVDVPDRDGAAPKIVRSARLSPGQAVMFGVSDPAPKLVAAQKAVDWTRGLLEFDHARLSEVVAEANRYAVIKIVLAEPELASLRVSGRFRVDDGSALAERLAALFDLSVDRRRPGVVLLYRRAAAK